MRSEEAAGGRFCRWKMYKRSFSRGFCSCLEEHSCTYYKCAL